MVAAPAVASRLQAAGDLKAALILEPLLACNLDLPLIDAWLDRNGMGSQPLAPALIGKDLRRLRSVFIKGYGWTAMSDYLCRADIERGDIQEILAPMASTQLSYYLVWTPTALRQPRVDHARQTLLWQLGPSPEISQETKQFVPVSRQRGGRIDMGAKRVGGAGERCNVAIALLLFVTLLTVIDKGFTPGTQEVDHSRQLMGRRSVGARLVHSTG